MNKPELLQRGQIIVAVPRLDYLASFDAVHGDSWVDEYVGHESPPVCYIPVGWPHQRVSAVRNAAAPLAVAVSSVAQATYPSGRTNTIGSVASAGGTGSTRPAHLRPMAAPAPAGVRSTNLPPRKISYSRVFPAFPGTNRISGA